MKSLVATPLIALELREQPVVPLGFTTVRSKPPMNESPGYASAAQKIADVLASHGHLVAGRVGTNVADRVGIAGHGQRTIAAAYHFVARPVQGRGYAVRLA